MPNKKLSVGLTVVLAIITVAPFVTGTRAVAQETVLHSFSPNNPKFGDLPLAGLIFDAGGQSLRHDRQQLSQSRWDGVRINSGHGRGLD